MLVGAAVLAGCAPTVIWTGHTADRRHAIEIAAGDGVQWVAVDGARRAGYKQIAAWSIVTGAPDRVVYAAAVGGDWVVVDDGRRGPAWTGIGEIAIAGHRTAYSAERGGRWHVVVDGVAGAAWDSLLASTLRFSADGAHVVYVARDSQGAHVVVDGRAGSAWPGAAQLVVSPSGAHVAYAARVGETWRVVVDGVAGPTASAVRWLAFAGETPVYAATGPDGVRVVLGATPSEPYRAVRALVTSGGHAAWIARDGEGDLAACDGAIVGRAATLAESRLAVVRGCELAYGAQDGAAWRVVTRAGADDAYDEVGTLVVASGHLAYAARRGATWQIVVDGQAREGGSLVGDPVLSPDGARVGFVARRGRWVAVVDARVVPFDLVMEGTLAFSADGQRWAVLAGELATERLFFALDGTRRIPLASAEVYSAAAQFSATSPFGDHGDILRRWTAAEANKP